MPKEKNENPGVDAVRGLRCTIRGYRCNFSRFNNPEVPVGSETYIYNEGVYDGLDKVIDLMNTRIGGKVDQDEVSMLKGIVDSFEKKFPDIDSIRCLTWFEVLRILKPFFVAGFTIYSEAISNCQGDSVAGLFSVDYENKVIRIICDGNV
jgi:hypothetical protein